MKQVLILALFTAFFSGISYAQDTTAHNAQPVKNTDRPSKVYFDVSTGINNPGSMVGLGADFHVDKNVSIDAGVGLLSTWGYKLYAGGKYFLQPNHKGSAFSGGITYNTGLPEFHIDLQTQSGTTENVQLDLASQVNVFVAWYRYWQLGKHNNRFYFTAGYSVATSNHKFTQTGGSKISTASATVMKRLAPGGLMVGIGFSFGSR